MKNENTAIYSTGEILVYMAAHAVSIHIIAERWRHAPTKVTPQVLKSSIAVFFCLLSFFYLITSTPRLHSYSLSVHLHRFAPHHLLFSSPVKWSLRPVWSPYQLPPPSCPLICQSRSIPDCLPSFFTLSHSHAHLAAFVSLSFSFVPLLLSPCTSFFSSSDLSIYFLSIPIPILFPLIHPSFNFSFLHSSPIAFLWH